MPTNLSEQQLREQFVSTLKGFTTVLNDTLRDLRKAKSSTAEVHNQLQSMAARLVSEKNIRTPRQQALLGAIDYSRLFGERLVTINKLANLQLQLEKVQKVLQRKSLDPVSRQAAAKQLADLKSQQGFASSILELTDTQIQRYEALVNTDKSLTEAQKEYLDAVITTAKAEAELTHANNANRQSVYNQVQLGKERVARAKQYMAVESAVARQNIFSNRMEGVFGFSFDSISSKMQEVGDLLRDPALLLVTALESLKFVLSKLNEPRTMMRATAFQTFGITGATLGGFGKGIGQGVLSNPFEAARAAATLTNAYGSIGFLTKDLVADQLRLTKIYGLTGDEASHVVHLIDFMSDRSNALREHTMDFVKALAKANQIPIGALFQDISQYSETFARYGIEGAAAFAKAAASSRLIGVSLSKIDDLADSALNAQGFIEKTATLNTFLSRYGVYLDPAKVIYYAQTNQLDKIQDMLKSQFGRINTTMLAKDRITMNQMMGLGLSAEDIQDIIHGSRISGTQVRAPTARQFGTDVMDNLLSSIESLASILSGLTHALTFLATVLGAQALMGGRIGAGLLGGGISRIGGVFGKMFGGGAGAVEGLEATTLGAGGAGLLATLGSRALPMAGKVLKGAGEIGGVLSLGTGLFDVGKTAVTGGNVGRALERHLFTEIGALAGGILGGVFGIGAGAVPGALLGAAGGGLLDTLFGLGKEPTAGGAVPMPQELTINTRPIEDRLDALIALFKDGTVSVRMDGKKVGSLAIAAHGTRV